MIDFFLDDGLMDGFSFGKVVIGFPWEKGETWGLLGGQRWSKLRNELGGWYIWGLDVITTRVDLTVLRPPAQSLETTPSWWNLKMLRFVRSAPFSLFCHMFETHTALASLDVLSKQLTQFFLESFPSAEVTWLASLCQRWNGRCARALTTVSPWANNVRSKLKE